jgi:hypothetical protein
MMRVRRTRCASRRSSLSSSAAWLIAASGLRISWAMLAVSRPSAASLSCCASSRERVVSSRNSTRNTSSVPDVEQAHAEAAAAHLEVAAAPNPGSTSAISRPSSLRLAEQAQRLRVVLHHAGVAVEHHDPVVQVLDDELVDPGLGLEAAAALPGEGLVRRDPLREPARDAGGGEAADREQAGLQEVGARRCRGRAPSSPARAAARLPRAPRRDTTAAAAPRSPRR